MSAPHRSARPLLAAALALPLIAVGLTACGSQGAEHTITIDGLKYAPATLEIEAGDTVVWDMTSHGMPHDVVSDDGLFASEVMTEGEFRYTFTEPGEYGYHCTPHPPMTGTITVVERG